MKLQTALKGSLAVLASVSGLAVGTLGVIQLIHELQIYALWRSMQTRPGQRAFADPMLADLPAPARRYLRRAIKPGANLASSVELKMRGEYTHAADIHAPKYPFKGVRILTAGKGFVYKVVVPGAGLRRIRENGFAFYVNGKGFERAKYLNLIPIRFRLNNPADITRTFLERFITDLVLLPSALLPQEGVRWQTVDDDHASVTVSQDGAAMTLTLAIGPEGQLREVVFDYWSAKGGARTYQPIPCGMQIHEERTFGDYTIPSRFNFIWWYKVPDREPGMVFDFVIDQARFS